MKANLFGSITKKILFEKATTVEPSLPDPTSLPPPIVNPNSVLLPRRKLMQTKSLLLESVGVFFLLVTLLKALII